MVPVRRSDGARRPCALPRLLLHAGAGHAVRLFGACASVGTRLAAAGASGWTHRHAPHRASRHRMRRGAGAPSRAAHAPHGGRGRRVCSSSLQSLPPLLQHDSEDVRAWRALPDGGAPADRARTRGGRHEGRRMPLHRRPLACVRHRHAHLAAARPARGGRHAARPLPHVQVELRVVRLRRGNGAAAHLRRVHAGRGFAARRATTRRAAGSTRSSS